MDKNDCNKHLKDGFQILSAHPIQKLYVQMDPKQNSFVVQQEKENREAAQEITHKISQDEVDSLAYVLRYVVLQSAKAAQDGVFSLEDVMNRALLHPTECQHCGSLPHKKEPSLGNVALESAFPSILDEFSSSLSALSRAQKISEKATALGFDWKNKEDAWLKVEEELQEMKVELKRQDKENVELEFGDFLFSLVKVALNEGIIAEKGLQRTCDKFVQRFRVIEAYAIANHRPISALTDLELKELWDQAKVSN